MGQSKISVFRALFGTEELAQRANAAFETAYERLIDEGRAEPIDGAAQAITRLREAGVKVALTTGFSGTTQEKLLAALGWQALADVVLAPGNGVRGRPNPDLILTALMRLDVDGVHNVASLGDTSSDIESALRAGAAIAAGTLTGAHNEDQLRSAGATHVVGSVSRIRRPDPAEPLTQRRKHEATYPPARCRDSDHSGDHRHDRGMRRHRIVGFGVR